jgi:hypothetical protein
VKYKHKPTIVEAMHYGGGRLAGQDIEKWSGGRLYYLEYYNRILMENEQMAEAGSYIVRDVVGNFYPCPEDVFKTCYEEADATAITSTLI